MNVRVKIPMNLWITSGKELDPLDATFTDGEHGVKCSFTLGDPLELSGDTKRFATLVHDAVVTISSVKFSKSEECFSVVAPIVNRVLRGIRHYGMVPQVQEFETTPDYADEYLYHWHAELQEEDGSWKSMLDLLAVLGLAHPGPEGARRAGYVDAIFWPDVREAIEHDLPSHLHNLFTRDKWQKLLHGRWRSGKAMEDALHCRNMANI